MYLLNYMVVKIPGDDDVRSLESAFPDLFNFYYSIWSYI
jgi:hypothetical protein